MKRLLLVISDQAMSDLIDVWTYIAEKNTENADIFIDKLYEKCELLASSPHIGKKRDELVYGICSGYRDLDSLF